LAKQNINLRKVTEKQIILKIYLTNRLGYDLSKDIDSDFLRVTGNNAFNYSTIRYTKDKPHVLKLQYYGFDQNENLYKPKKYGLFDYLFDEIDVKTKKKITYKKKEKSEYTSASEYSSHVFCPINIVLSNRFIIPPAVVQGLGTEMHEKTLLINKFTFIDGESISSRQDYGKSPDYYIDESNTNFFEDINSSKIIYSGHSHERDKYFFGKKSRFVGQPDYIFVNKSGVNYVVEEKFRLLSGDHTRVGIFKSNRIQILSYIYMLDELKINYGYIVYWISETKNGGYGKYVELEKCVVFRIDRTDKNHFLLGEVYKDYQAIKYSGKEIEFDSSSINPNKCGSCSASMFCSHKLGNDKSIKYDDNYESNFNVNYLPFPEELRKTAEEKAQNIKDAENNITEDNLTDENAPLA
jgi:hypothetical protein